MTTSSRFSPFLPSLVEGSGEHDWMSKVGERKITAECRVVGHWGGDGRLPPGADVSKKETPLHPLHDIFVIRLAMPKAYHRAVERRVYRP